MAFEAKELGARSSFARPVGVRSQVCRLRGKALELSHFLLLGDDDSAPGHLGLSIGLISSPYWGKREQHPCRSLLGTPACWIFWNLEPWGIGTEVKRICTGKGA